MADAATVSCSRCARSAAPALERPPRRGAIGAELAARVCADCWREWERAEVMVINELRLDFMDPAAPALLDVQMRRFLLLDAGPS